MNDAITVTTATTVPPFLFHYIIAFVIVTIITCICVLKFKYFYWYSQPLTFRYTVGRFLGYGSANTRHRTNIMNPLSLGQRCYQAVVYPFLHHVNHNSVHVYHGTDEDVPFERIASILSKYHDTERNSPEIIACSDSDTLRVILSQDTFGLSAFIGVLLTSITHGGTDGNNDIGGVSVLTSRIMISFNSSLTTSPYRSVSIYMCEYLVWNKYIVSECKSLELLETTEYIQKSREIAGEQTLYRYREIPWFVVPFTTVYSYMFQVVGSRISGVNRFNHGISFVRVSSTNFALFYAFVNEHTRDFHCCILNELTQLQSLVEHELYIVYILLLNNTRVIATYILTHSVANDYHLKKDERAEVTPIVKKTSRKKTKGNRIAALHDYVSRTSNALVKYLPPVIPPKYDAFGKRISANTVGTAAAETEGRTTHSRDSTVLRLLSSIQDKSLCDIKDFVRGFQYISKKHSHIDVHRNDVVVIDTIAHNYRLIDALTLSIPSASTEPKWPLLSKDKWYYILYNAIIHEETLCKDILII